MHVANIKVKALLSLSMTVYTIFLLILASIGLDRGALDLPWIYIWSLRVDGGGGNSINSMYLQL